MYACKSNNHSTTELVQSGGEVLLNGKAYNNRVVTLWLSAELRDAVSQGCGGGDRIMPLVCICVSRVCNLFYFFRSTG